jgi:hypothetical protein
VQLNYLAMVEKDFGGKAVGNNFENIEYKND